MKDQKASEWRFPHFRNHAIYSLNILQKIKKWYCIITKKTNMSIYYPHIISILYLIFVYGFVMQPHWRRCGGYMICSAQMTIFIAARTARVPHGERRHASTAGSPAPSRGSAAQRLRPAWHFFRSPPPGCRLPACGEGHPKLAAPAPPEIGKILSSVLQQSDERRHWL